MLCSSIPDEVMYSKMFISFIYRVISNLTQTTYICIVVILAVIATSQTKQKFKKKKQSQVKSIALKCLPKSPSRKQLKNYLDYLTRGGKYFVNMSLFAMFKCYARRSNLKNFQIPYLFYSYSPILIFFQKISIKYFFFGRQKFNICNLSTWRSPCITNL